MVNVNSSDLHFFFPKLYVAIIITSRKAGKNAQDSIHQFL